VDIPAPIIGSPHHCCVERQFFMTALGTVDALGFRASD